MASPGLPSPSVAATTPLGSPHSCEATDSRRLKKRLRILPAHFQPSFSGTLKALFAERRPTTAFQEVSESPTFGGKENLRSARKGPLSSSVCLGSLTLFLLLAVCTSPLGPIACCVRQANSSVLFFLCQRSSSTTTLSARSPSADGKESRGRSTRAGMSRGPCPSLLNDVKHSKP